MTDFGGKLRHAREQQGVSLHQIAARTKISVAVLEALERNDVSKLPGGIFSRGFVRSYASVVGLDPDQTVREFLERFARPSTPPAAAHATVVHRASRVLPGPPLRIPLPSDEEDFESRQEMVRTVLKLAAVSVPIVGLILYFTLGRGPAR